MRMDSPEHDQRIVSASREIAAPAEVIFELIADPSQQPRWDGNDNLAAAEPGQRVSAVGDVFTTVLTHTGFVRENHVVEFDEGRLVAWRPAEPGGRPPGHLWRWELEPVDTGRTRVTHTYDWSSLDDPGRLERARSTTSERLLASVERLAALVEGPGRHGDGTEPLDLLRHLHEQLDWHWQVQARPRLEGLTDEEYLWEPAPGTWNVRRGQDPVPGTVTRRAGAGEWLLDLGDPQPQPAPVTSIAWRLAHVTVDVLGARAHAHFGGPAADQESWSYAGTAQEALTQLDAAYEAWSAGVRGLDLDDLATPVGSAEGSWAEHPMLGLVLHINRETIHHLAEVALLRDLWANRGTMA
ncbi:hypothetical protein GCM10011509_08590 [Ornithinimicrobium pekingense]|uniref:DinB-like domain-containing protein n=2 Tax=Ornithinimicrobium pekingense TaxID=384677 RepID=A0ABQ2F5A8_9MICO|nr:hypothetical protein GCM10011509_08590 [Ornithinimicrobium pekingense]